MVKILYILYILVIIIIHILSKNAPRPPGTLLLNMLTKNEAEHLNRTLPHWAKIIDAWVIGIDDKNDDNSPEIIKKHLGHIPGEVVVVHFDGMGPTWSKLVDVGLANYPNITHGIIADADFKPIQDNLDKMELDIRCSKHMYYIKSSDHQSERKMDWIYRNVPGAKVLRRTHQSVEVPAFPNQEVFQTLINLKVDEQPGGYQDRTGKKAQNYIDFLDKDLIDMPGDARTLYYLGYAHLDMFMTGYSKGNSEKFHWDHLALAVEFFEKRVNTQGNFEEGWFARMKWAEVMDRFYKKWEKSLELYEKCHEEDKQRADPLFYIGQHYRLAGDYEKAIPYLIKSAEMPMPDRALFNWKHLYTCLLELARAVVFSAQSGTEHEVKDLERYLKAIKNTNCNGEAASKTQIGPLITQVSDLLNDAKNKNNVIEQKPAQIQKKQTAKVPSKPPIVDSITLPQPSRSDKLNAIKSIVSFVSTKLSTFEENLSAEQLSGIMEYSTSFQEYLEDPNIDSSLTPCRDYRQVTSPYLNFILKLGTEISNTLDDEVLWSVWSKLNQRVSSICR